jgi:chromosome segregation ATPase
MLSSVPFEANATQPWVDAAEESWAARLELFRSVIPRAYPDAVPPSLIEGLREMSKLVDQARRIRRDLSENVLQAKEHEDNLRAARLRVGHAADELGHDESRVARRMTEAQTAMNEVRARLAELDARLGEGVRELAQLRAPRLLVTRPTAELLRELGVSAAIWLETEAQLATLTARVIGAEREREDLRFQIAQLKGRLGILNAEADTDLNALRVQADALEHELSRVLEALARTTEPVAQQLAAIPSVRDVIASSRTPPTGRNAASGA